MAANFHSIMFRFLFILLLIARSQQLVSENKDEKIANCYNECQKNFTTNSINDEQVISACHKGCRFFSLILHASHDFNPTTTYNAVKEGCILSCGESYTNMDEVTGCNFGCTSLKSADPSDVFEHQLRETHYAIIITEPDVFIYPGDPDPDEALVDPGLKKQIEKTLESLLDPKPKIPEIHFRNLPIPNEEIQVELPRTTFKCLKFYGFQSELGFRNGKIKYFSFHFSVRVIAILCFIFILFSEPMRKFWKQIFHITIQNRSGFAEGKEILTKPELIVNDDYSEKAQLLEVKCEPAK